MSGLETIWVALGALPVLVNALEFYKARSKDVINHVDFMNELILGVHEQHVRFQDSCFGLMQGLVDDSELE